MTTQASDIAFSGSIPELYERYMVPLIFEPYARDIAARVRRCEPQDVLEIAAGTGVVTRRLAEALPPSTTLVATDLNAAMLDVAQARGTAIPVVWQQADAMKLPFAGESFDVAVCQFGAMFFPDRPQAYCEVLRVLRPGGTFVFNVWDTLATNDFARVVQEALAARFPSNPPAFMGRIPHGYADPDLIRRDLAAAGFHAAATITPIEHASPADSARTVATAYCQATPLRGEIEAQGDGLLAEATGIAEQALMRQFGAGPISGRIRAWVVEVPKSRA